MHACVYACMYIRCFVCINVCVYVRVYLCRYICSRAHTHTHTHTLLIPTYKCTQQKLTSIYKRGEALPSWVDSLITKTTEISRHMDGRCVSQAIGMWFSTYVYEHSCVCEYLPAWVDSLITKTTEISRCMDGRYVFQAYIHTYIHTYIQTNKHTYTHTYIHTHTAALDQFSASIKPNDHNMREKWSVAVHCILQGHTNIHTCIHTYIHTQRP